MKTKNKTADVKDALTHRPALISHYMRHPHYDRKVTQGILRGMLPLRTSMELECTDSLLLGLLKEGRLPAGSLNKSLDIKGLREFDRKVLFEKIKNLYGLFEFNQDLHNSSSELTEHRISISGYRQAFGLYSILRDIKRHCRLNDGGGIHLHVDISMLNFERPDELKDFLTSKLDYVYELFGGYTGTYNKRGVAVECKDKWINIRRKYKSVEFRIGKCTFEYDEIMKWMIGCNSIVKEYCNIKRIEIPKELTLEKPVQKKLPFQDIRDCVSRIAGLSDLNLRSGYYGIDLNVNTDPAVPLCGGFTSAGDRLIRVFNQDGSSAEYNINTGVLSGNLTTYAVQAIRNEAASLDIPMPSIEAMQDLNYRASNQQLRSPVTTNCEYSSYNSYNSLSW